MKFADAVRAQMKLAVHSRAVWFVMGICVLPWIFTVAIMALSRRVVGTAEIGPELLISPAGALVCFALGVVWGIVVWRDEPPRSRFYHWSLPMDTSHHDLARVVAYLLWFLVGLVLYMITGLIMMFLHDVPMHFAAVGIMPWLATIAAGVIGYGVGAAYSTAFERPLEYVVGTLILIWGIAVLGVLYRLDGVRSFIAAVLGPKSQYGLMSAISTAGRGGMNRYVDAGAPAEFLPAAAPLAVWLAVAAAAVTVSAFYNRGRVR